MSNILNREQFDEPICPHCGSDFGDWDRTEEPNQVWCCFDCGTIKFKLSRYKHRRRIT